jgi:hypothetical protein
MALMSALDARTGDADADPTVRLAAPSLSAVARIVAIVVACAMLLYLAWRLRDVLRLVVISVFLALALLPVVDAIDARVRVPRAAIILSLYAALAAGVIVVGRSRGPEHGPGGPAALARRAARRAGPAAQ